MSGPGASTDASTGAGTVAGERVEIVTRGGRRSYTVEEKLALVAEASQPGSRVLAVAQRHGLSPSLLHRWRREAEGRPLKPLAKAKPAPRLPALVPLVMEPPMPTALPEAKPEPRPGGAIEVVLRNGRLLRIGAGADVAAVARLAAALEA
ncbi:IS66-like element accessory protein TnpA [Sabulicella glaciei]|uniref:Transposase n=1 Tax=Sabulicella glaciei TaxID=2984948 RepID=A0ABT3NZL8_9PROT|nr:transposase [Roseococcus sp. MDT2-1-1]MCW8087612.1 transposase [Roseococcus sp. MDT2-1-1]